MNNEDSRLRTFHQWPSDAAVDSARIAKAGFFYTGQGLEVQCFSCGAKITEWNYGDQVMARHRRLDPRCPFVLNPTASGNVPKVTTVSTIASSSSTTSSEVLSYRTEASRLQTFTTWPIPGIVAPIELARAGFYSLKQGDKVKCAYCQGVAGYWEPGDDPRAEHRKHFPRCIFVELNFDENAIQTRTVQTDSSRDAITSINSNSKLISSENLHELGIQAHRGPRQPRYATFESRLRTYVNWSSDLIQTPEMLAEAGFYYVGTGDQVRCFHCDGGLRHWDPDDEPWVEHAKWFPACAFVQLIKGQDFIQSSNPEQLTHNTLISIQPNGRTPRAREISDQEMQMYMNTAPALQALSIGLHVGRVKQAIRLKIQQTGSDYSTADALIEAALNLQIEETDAPPTELDSEISQQVTNILSNALIQSVDKEQKEQLIVPTTASEVESKPELSLEEENRQLKEARLCKICMDNEIGVVFLPCGHLATCINCAPSLKDCPVCRSVIKGTVRTFLS